MRILAVNWLDRENPQAGGAEVHFFEIFRRLAAWGAEITLIASGWTGSQSEASVDGIQIRRLGGRHSFALHARGAVRRLLARTGRSGAGYDVVVEDINKLPLFLPTVTSLPVYVIVPHLFGATAFREAPWPIAATVWLAERPIPWIYRRATFHAISQSTRDDLIRRGLRPEAVRVIFPGVDSVWYAPDSTIGRRPDPAFLYVGRLKRYKGVDVALRALAQARGEGHQLRLDIAGQGDDRPRLERLVQDLGLTQTVRFLGVVSETDKRELLRSSWAVVLPSAKEGWGITNIEAAACGTPAIASDSPGLRETVRQGETGLLVPHGDPRALAAALVRLAVEPGLVSRFGQAARRFAEGLSWERAARETRDHLETTVTRLAKRAEGVV